MRLARVLVANRGEVAVRIVRACRDLGVPALAVYEPADAGALHVRLADAAHPVDSYFDAEALVAIARRSGCDAVHPGYGFLAERADFARECAEAGLAFAGASPEIFDRLATLSRVAAAGFPTVSHAARSFAPGDGDALEEAASTLGFPVVLKPVGGGRCRFARWVDHPAALRSAARAAADEALSVYADDRLYVERAVASARVLGVPILADARGGLVSLGTREGTVLRRHQKLVEESPAPSLDAAGRARLETLALDIARHLGLFGAATIELLADGEDRFLFTEVKGRLPREHPVTEMTSGVDLVVEQLRLAGGETLATREGSPAPGGAAIACRVNAEDPWRGFLPVPGRVRRLRLPGGPHVRVETHLFAGADVSARYDASLAGVHAWAPSRPQAVARLERALRELTIVGLPTTIPFLLGLVGSPRFAKGEPFVVGRALAELAPRGDAKERRAAAVAAALAFAARSAEGQRPPTLGWGWPHEDGGAR